MSDFVYGDGHRWYTDPKKCPHYNENVCKGCDFDGYYAANYATCPWGDERLERALVAVAEMPWETTLGPDDLT